MTGTPVQGMPETADPLIELIRVVPDLAWVGLVALSVWWLYPRLRSDVLLRLRQFKGYGIEAELAEQRLEEASKAQNVPVPFRDRKQLLKRIDRLGGVLNAAHLLWVDDRPTANKAERALLEGFGAKIDRATTSAQALKHISADIDLIVSDMKREGKDTEGADFAQKVYELSHSLPVIIYTGTNQERLPVPAYVFGITNRPDELIHLILDALERTRL